MIECVVDPISLHEAHERLYLKDSDHRIDPEIKLVTEHKSTFIVAVINGDIKMAHYLIEIVGVDTNNFTSPFRNCYSSSSQIHQRRNGGSPPIIWGAYTRDP